MNGWYALLASGLGWLIAQAWKTVVGLLGRGREVRKMGFAELVGFVTRSGGMPSGHSAAMTGLTTYIGMAWGWDSGLFALALVITLIVIYDAIHVRYAVGLQGEELNAILKKDGKKPLAIVEGHTVAQAAVGALIGIITGVVVGILLKA